MQAPTQTGPRKHVPAGTRLGRAALLALPSVGFLALVLRHPEAGMVLWAGAAALALGALVAFLAGSAGREPAGPPLILLNAAALIWLLVALPQADGPVINLVRAGLVVVPVWLFGLQCLRDSGATALRRARQIAAGLARRGNWPADHMAIRQLPEVQAFREALHVDASPALELLVDLRPAVRVAALAALEFRPVWRPGQAQIVLQLAQRAPEPEVRAAAVSALANIEDRTLTEAVAELMRDPSPLVRQTTTSALLWNTADRWNWLRNAVRAALADPECQHDGPLALGGQPLSDEAVDDLHGWAAEKGVIALRAALTLGAHYAQMLAAGTEPELAEKLRGALTGPRTPALLRLEMARLMYQYGELLPGDLYRLLQPAMPAPVRLIAVEALLAAGNSPEALAALHDLARLPNREIALATADVVQRRLGIEMGLPRGEAMPAVGSRLAAEVARRVLLWSTRHEMDPAAPRAPSLSSRVELG
jgi:HEAT repeat protein